jgi:hypothetical protein
MFAACIERSRECGGRAADGNEAHTEKGARGAGDEFAAAGFVEFA